MKILEVGADYFGLYGQHLKDLDATDRLSRFGFMVRDESIDQIILNMLYHPRDHYLFAAQIDGEVVAFGHLARDQDAWELAVSVGQKFQGRGIGDSIIGFCVKWAQTHGLQTLYMHCITDNQKVQHLARKHGLRTVSRGSGEITAELEVPPPTMSDYVVNHMMEQTRIMGEIASLQRELLKSFTLRGKSDINQRAC